MSLEKWFEEKEKKKKKKEKKIQEKNPGKFSHWLPK